jgi:hypothetical protein
MGVNESIDHLSLYQIVRLWRSYSRIQIAKDILYPL